MSEFAWAAAAIFGWMLVTVLFVIQRHLSAELVRLTSEIDALLAKLEGEETQP
jgi:hypothetical protein